MQRFSLFLLITLYLLSGIVAANDEKIQNDKNVLSKDSLVTLAYNYLGIDQGKGNRSLSLQSFTEYTIQDNKLPFIESRKLGNEVVKFDVNFNFEHGQGHFCRNYERELKILMDPITGALLSIYSLDNNAGSSDTLPEPPIAVNRKTMAKIIGGLKAPPIISLNEAIKSCWKNPAEAKVFRAAPIDYAFSDTKTIPVWLIILRGCKNPLKSSNPLGGRMPPANQRNSVIIAINAETGHFMFMGTAPSESK